MLVAYFYLYEYRTTTNSRNSARVIFFSESDYPGDIVQLEKAGWIENELLELATKPAGTAIEKTTLDYFLVNITRSDPAY